MKTFSRRDLYARLKGANAPPPPEGLLERIRSEIPERMTAEGEPVDLSARRFLGLSRGQAMRLAASVFLVAGAAFVVVKSLPVAKEGEPAAPATAAAPASPAPTVLAEKEPVPEAAAEKARPRPAPTLEKKKLSEAQPKRSLTAPEASAGSKDRRVDQPAPTYAAAPKHETARDEVMAEGRLAMTAGAAAVGRAGDALTPVRRALEAGRFPAPGSVSIDEFLAFFVEGEPPAAGEAFSVAVEGAPSPFPSSPAERLLRVVVQRGTGASGARDKDAALALEFNGAVLSSWRRVGGEGVEGFVPAGRGAVALWEFEPKPRVQRLPFVNVRLFRGEGADRKAEVDRAIGFASLVKRWEEASPAFRLASLAAALAGALKDPPGELDARLQEIARRAEALAREMPSSPRAAELARLADLAAHLPPRP